MRYIVWIMRQHCVAAVGRKKTWGLGVQDRKAHFIADGYPQFSVGMRSSRNLQETKVNERHHTGCATRGCAVWRRA